MEPLNCIMLYLQWATDKKKKEEKMKQITQKVDFIIVLWLRVNFFLNETKC